VGSLQVEGHRLGDEERRSRTGGVGGLGGVRPRRDADEDHLRALLSGERRELVIVGAIYDPALVRVIRAAHAVLLSRDAIVKQERRHPDIQFAQYCLIPYVLRYGVVAQEWAEQLIFSWVDPTKRPTACRRHA